MGWKAADSVARLHSLLFTLQSWVCPSLRWPTRHWRFILSRGKHGGYLSWGQQMSWQRWDLNQCLHTLCRDTPSPLPHTGSPEGWQPGKLNVVISSLKSSILVSSHYCVISMSFSFPGFHHRAPGLKPRHLPRPSKPSVFHIFPMVLPTQVDTPLLPQPPPLPTPLPQFQQ